jgi:alanyl-tRNA synthetase
VLDSDLPEMSSNVWARIDGDRRLRNMQHHSAQHLLSQCWLRLYEIDSVSANISPYSPSTLDVQVSGLEREAMEAVEELANRLIQEDREIKSYWIDTGRVGDLPLRMPPAISGLIRVVEIEGYDYTACGGTHCTRTGMIGAFKIVKRERLKDKTRLHFVAGMQALEYFRAYHNIVRDLTAGLSIHPEELVATVQRQGEDLKAVQRDLEKLRRQALAFEARDLAAEAQPLGANRLALVAFDARPANELRWLADELRKEPGLVAVLAAHEAGKFSLVVACAPDTGRSARKLLQDLLAPLGGRGGGDDSLAQGGGAATQEHFAAWVEGAAELLS